MDKANLALTPEEQANLRNNNEQQNREGEGEELSLNDLFCLSQDDMDNYVY